METTRTSECRNCGAAHAATYHHEGSFGEGAIFEVICPVDGLSDFVTVWGLN